MVVNFAVKGNNPAVAHFPHGLVAQISMIASRRKPIPLLPIWSTVTLKFIEARDCLSSTHHLGTFSAQSLGRPRPIIAIDPNPLLTFK